MTICQHCHHMPSGRIADYGAACHCKCHDIADAGPELLAACKAARHTLSVAREDALNVDRSQEAKFLGDALRVVCRAIAKAEGTGASVIARAEGAHALEDEIPSGVVRMEDDS